MAKVPKRCVNLDWLEVYCLEDSQRYPCDADYFRRQGYFVRERDYGTRQYAQAFTIEDAHGDPWIEVRRAPKSGDTDYSGYVPESCNLRLVNRYCYANDPIQQLTNFMLLHGYVFKKIFRIDICYDFVKFDSGDDPETFARRYIARQYRKVNQAKLSLVGDDAWSDFSWQSLKWGNEKSMVSTKMYDKTLELKANKTDKPYIKYAWWECGLVDHPVELYKIDEKGKKTFPHVWRIEFSMKSKARNWIVIEWQGGKKVKKKRLPHYLNMFDSKDKIWQRFEELAFHYFSFRKKEYKNVKAFMFQPTKGDGANKVTLEVKRKYDCPEKVLFKFNFNREFHQLDQLPKETKKNNEEVILRRRLIHYQEHHMDPKIRAACQTLLDNLTRDEWLGLCEHRSQFEYEILQRALARKLAGDDGSVCEIIQELRELLKDGAIF